MHDRMAQLRHALSALQRTLPGRFPAKLESWLLAAPAEVQQEFLQFARHIQDEIIAAERRGAQRFMRTGRFS